MLDDRPLPLPPLLNRLLASSPTLLKGVWNTSGLCSTPLIGLGVIKAPCATVVGQGVDARAASSGVRVGEAGPGLAASPGRLGAGGKLARAVGGDARSSFVLHGMIKQRWRNSTSSPYHM